MNPAGAPAGAARPAHPGLPVEPRRIALQASAVRHFEALIAPGEEVFDFADRLARGLAGSAALLRFAALRLDPIAIHVPEPDPTRRQIMRYGPARVFDGACELVGGQMSIGVDGEEAPVLHGHAHVLTADGRSFGGHLSRGGCVVSRDARPTPVRCTVFEGVRLEPTFDAETGFSLLSPVAAADRTPPRARVDPHPRAGSADVTVRPAAGRSGWMLRFKPDEDLVDAMAALAAVENVSGLQVIGGVGSLMRATLAGADGRIAEIDGPGVEIVNVEGPIDALRIVVADLDGRVHDGRPVAGGNPICVTIELFVEATA